MSVLVSKAFCWVPRHTAPHGDPHPTTQCKIGMLRAWEKAFHRRRGPSHIHGPHATEDPRMLRSRGTGCVRRELSCAIGHCWTTREKVCCPTAKDSARPECRARLLISKNSDSATSNRHRDLVREGLKRLECLRLDAEESPVQKCLSMQFAHEDSIWGAFNGW
ncbi:hypothetical protein K438DRAFT_1784714 [Mycena galopus ATCC 62051]|nr:hypothetical protein K438DRAFT_1784714 [Mycena galopus ATCC 62051]